MGLWCSRHCFCPCVKRADGTAMGVAKIRFIESMLPEDYQLFSDPYAGKFAPIGVCILSRTNAEKIINAWREKAPGIYQMLVGRTRWLDDVCRDAVKDGCEQLIILGAGYDTRPIRINELSGITKFEVDQKEVHELKMYGYKNLHLTEAQWANLHLVAVDFNKENVLKLANHEDFKKGSKSVVLIEGVTQYIPESATAETLRCLKELVAPGSIVGISYVDKATFGSDEEIKEKISEDPSFVHRMIRGLPKNEQWITSWSKDGFSSFMKNLSYEIEEDVTVEDFEERYFNGKGRTAKPFLRTERYAKVKLV
jgi:methyltransferase (TIGR00027 family)